MKTVLAALDTSPSAAAVLDTALRLGELTGGTVEAVHVHDGPTSRSVARAQAGSTCGCSKVPSRKASSPPWEKPVSMPPCSEHGRPRRSPQSAAPHSTCSS